MSYIPCYIQIIHIYVVHTVYTFYIHRYKLYILPRYTHTENNNIITALV